MAAREHQGMQIALIIFVVLTISLIVTSYWFFDQFKNEQKKFQGEVKHAQKSEAEQKVAIENLEKIKRMMNFGARDEVSTMEGEFKKDMEKFAKTFPESNQHYRFVVQELDKQIKKQNASLIDAQQREAVLIDKGKKDETVKVAELANYEQADQKTKQDAAAERDKFNKDRDVLKKNDVEIANKLEQKRKEFDELAQKSAKDIEVVAKRLSETIKINESLVTKDKEAVLSEEHADGKVTWVNQRARVVWLNLGADDGLRRQISFAVISPDENNPLKADKKGSIEVTRVLDRHLAEARIIDDSPSNPIMPGDSVFSAAWQPGRAEHFALAGMMDIDKDGLSDRQKIRDIITLNGGIIDAEVLDDGKRIGNLTVETRYLVLGERPSDKSTSGDLLANYSALMKECASLPIKTISVPELIDYLGYKAKERTIPLGADSKDTDFRPRQPDGVQRKSNNNMMNKARPTPTAGAKSAY